MKESKGRHEAQALMYACQVKAKDFTKPIRESEDFFNQGLREGEEDLEFLKTNILPWLDLTLPQAWTMYALRNLTP